MTKFQGCRSAQFCSLFFWLLLLFTSGLAKDPSNSKTESKARSTGFKVLIICLSLVVVVGVCVLLFKLWQKKKREEQHAQLLKLFEEDDELEVELGMRD